MSDAMLDPTPARTTMARWPLIGLVALVFSSVAIAGFARQTGIGVTGAPASAVIAKVELRFEDRDDGAVVVSDGAGRVLDIIAVSTDGFIRGSMRSLARDRKRARLSHALPFLLERRENGRLSLSDPATGGKIELDAFGPSNAGAFARFLPAYGGRS